jgi:hypothetical protein
VTSNVTVISFSPAGKSTIFWRSGWPSVDSVTGTWRAGSPVVRITASTRITVRTNANSSAITFATDTSLRPGRAAHTVCTRVSSERRKSRTAPSPESSSNPPVDAPSEISTTPARSRPS